MRICSGQGCLRAVPDDVRLCDECASDNKQAVAPVDGITEHLNRYDAELDSLRKSQRWQRLRALVVRSCPMCARCNCMISEIVDHIVPARVAISQARLSGKYLDRNAGYFLRTNLQGLCRPCHWTKTMEDKTHVGEWPDVVERERLAPKRVYSF